MSLGGVSEQAVQHLENLLSGMWFVCRRIELDAGVVAEPGIEHELILSIAAAEAVLGDCRILGARAAKQRRVLGSVPNRVSHHAPCDVIIVHTV